nr:uncharacterized protein LOC120964194 [Aegilops tauschii subsp. strangulata]
MRHRAKLELSPTSGKSPLPPCRGFAERRPSGGIGMEFLIQPIRRNVVLEEVNNNEIPMESYLAVSTIADQLSPMAAAGEAPGWKAEYEPQACEQSIEHILTRKLLDGREGSGSELPLVEGRPCASRKSALEKAIHGFAKNLTL